MRRIVALFAFLSVLHTLAAAESPGRISAVVSSNAVLTLKAGSSKLCDFDIGLYEPDWSSTSASVSTQRVASESQRAFLLKARKGNAAINGVAELTPKDGGVRAKYQFTPATDVMLNSLHVSADFPAAVLIGAKWKAGEHFGVVPETLDKTGLHSSVMQSLVVELKNGLKLTWTFDEPTSVLLQDNRQWGPTFSVRIGLQTPPKNYAKGQSVGFGFTFSASTPIAMEFDRPVTIVAGPDWIPLKHELEIQPGSALDFSTQGFQDAPAGKYGRVIAREDGQFAFDKNPQIARRFYGVNFCFSALYISHEDADRVAERLMRLGYNAVRVHHYESELTRGQANSTTLNLEKIDQLDYLLAAFEKRGLYITTDLFVSRTVPNKEIGIDAPGHVEMDTYKILVPVVPAALENYKAFTRTLLTHVNPYTKTSYAADPALAWLSLINEGMYGNFMSRLRTVPEWNRAWNAFLAARYKTREALAAAWKSALRAEEDFAKNSVQLPSDIYGGGPRVDDCHIFFAVTERDFVAKMRSFLRDELGCKALITNANAWTNYLSDQAARATYDYVDDHFYVDHPHFLEAQWRLPSRCPNTSPIADGASGGRHVSLTRLFGKPFTITEYNFSGPGRFRGVGGILTGAMGSLQDWGGIWRFAYSHNSQDELAPGKMDYFNMSGDPLGQASERASLCLFLRGDMKPAPHAVALAVTEQDALNARPVLRLAPNWHWMAWLTRVGSFVASNSAQPAGHPWLAALKPGARAELGTPWEAPPYKVEVARLIDGLKSEKILAATNVSDPSKNIFQSETGEITINAQRDTMLLDTARTAGGYAPAGQTIATAAGALTVAIQDADATVWVSALDAAPITSSKRLLVTHLTDLQNSNIRYAENARQTLLAWGGLPHLVRAGKATVTIRNANAGTLKVWALSLSGRRLAEVPATAVASGLQFTADVAADAANGARMLYEIAPQ